MRKTPKKTIHPLVYEHDPVLQAISGVFLRSRLFVRATRGKPANSIYWVYSIYPPLNSNIPYWYCPLCTPSLTLPTSSLKCLQKSNPNIYTKCFRCFKCFGCFRCFISLLDHKTARFWSKSEQTRKIVTIQLCNNMGALSVGMLF